MQARVYIWIGGERVIGKLTHSNIKDYTLYIAILEQRPTFPSYKNFKVGDYVVVKNNRGRFVILRKVDKPIDQLSEDWEVLM